MATYRLKNAHFSYPAFFSTTYMKIFPLHWVAEILRAKSRDTGLIERVINFLVWHII